MSDKVFRWIYEEGEWFLLRDGEYMGYAVWSLGGCPFVIWPDGKTLAIRAFHTVDDAKAEAERLAVLCAQKGEA